MPLFYPYRLIPELLFPNTIFDASDRFLEMAQKQVKYDISENDKEFLIEMGKASKIMLFIQITFNLLTK